jgi:hypothetical protein
MEERIALKKESEGSGNEKVRLKTMEGTVETRDPSTEEFFCISLCIHL